MDNFDSDVEIVDLDAGDEPPTFDYAKRASRGNRRMARLRVERAGSALLSIDKPTGLFNPAGSPVARKFVAAILDGRIAVEGRRVVDLGCGCGLIGLVCVFAGAKRVTFTDIDPAAASVLRHPLFRPTDQFVRQDMLTDEASGSADLILSSPPALTTSDEKSFSADAGIFRPPDFLERLLTDAARVLVPGGRLVIWIRDAEVGGSAPIRFLEAAATLGFASDDAVILAQESEFAVDLREAENMLERAVFRLVRWAGHPDHTWYLLDLPLAVPEPFAGRGPARPVC